MPRTVASDVYKRLCAERRWNTRDQMALMGLSSTAVNTLTHGAATTSYATFHKIEDAMEIPYGFFEDIIEGRVEELQKVVTGDNQTGVSSAVLAFTIRRLESLKAAAPPARKKA